MSDAHSEKLSSSESSLRPLPPATASLLPLVVLCTIWMYGLTSPRSTDAQQVDQDVNSANVGPSEVERSAKHEKSEASPDVPSTSQLNNGAPPADLVKRVEPSSLAMSSDTARERLKSRSMIAASSSTSPPTENSVPNRSHRIVLFLFLICLVIGLLEPRLAPQFHRMLLKQFRRWSSLIVVVLGLLVVFFGGLGFAIKSEQPVPNTPFENKQQQDSPDISVVGQTIKTPPRETSELRSVLAAFYETFQIFAFNVPDTDLDNGFLVVAMSCAMLLALTIAFSGIGYLFYDSSVRVRLFGASGHVVILGLGRIGLQLLQDLIQRNDSRLIVVVDPDEESPNLKWARENGVITVIGDAKKGEDLVEVLVHRASEVFVVTGSDECNIESAIEIRELLEKHGRQNSLPKRIFRSLRNLPPLRCFVHILNRDLATVIRQHTEALENHEQQLWDLEVFNALERTARRLLTDIAARSLVRHSDESIKAALRPIRPRDTEEAVHYVMLGFGEFGQTLALELAELSHFESCNRPRFTFCDRAIENLAKPFLARYPRFGRTVAHFSEWSSNKQADRWGPVSETALTNASDTVGIQFVSRAQFIEYEEVTCEEFLGQLRQTLCSPGVRPVILVCFEADRQNFSVAERLREKLATTSLDWPIFVWIPRQRELSHLLQEQYDNAALKKHRGCEIVPFGQCYGSVAYDEVTNGWIDWLARQTELIWQTPKEGSAHEKMINALGSPQRASEFARIDWQSLDSNAKEIWQKKDEWARASNRSSAIHSVVKAAALGFRIEGLALPHERRPVTVPCSHTLHESLRKMEHYRWVSERLIGGWQFGDRNDNRRRTRWQITPWERLKHPPTGGSQEDQQQKDEKIINLLLGLIESGILKTSQINPPC